MKYLNTTLAFTLIITSSSLLADSNRYRDEGLQSIEHYDSATVLKVKPIYREIKVSTPVTECWQEPVIHTSNHQSAGGMAAGGLLGGIVGHQIGKGRGKKLATAMGVIIGAQMGHDAMKRKNKHDEQQYTEYQQRCDERHEVNYERVVDGYWVTYRYQGERHKIEMPYHPGKRIKMRIQITPVI